METFTRHIPLLKRIIKKFGYPTFEKVGVASSGHFFALVQHADKDVEFQSAALKMIKAQVQKKQAKGSNYALLFDRVQINSGKAQLYGSQIDYDSSGNVFPKKLADRKNVNQRRKEMGMIPLEDYLKQMAELHNSQNK